MDPPSGNDEVKPEKIEEEKGEGPSFNCDLFDTELIHKIAQALLHGLASACVDNTMGGLFKNPGDVAVDIRREMVEKLFQRSENFVAESVILEGGPHAEVSEHPYDIMSDFLEDFSSSKRNIFSRVSGWVLSDRREDRIDDFTQDMEMNGFWLLARREAVAQTFLKNVDFKNTYHCDKKFKSAEDLAEHVSLCNFRMMDCMNEGCDARFSERKMDYHDSVCPFKLLPCEQKCSEIIMRRDMDKHCITICPMKLVNCPFYPIGCQLTVPKCSMDEHLSEYLHSHLVHILKPIHKEASLVDLQKRAEQLEKLSSPGRLVSAPSARPLQFAIRDLEAKLGPIEVSKTDEKASEVSDQKQEITSLVPKHEERTEMLNRKEEHLESSTKYSESTDSSPRKSSISPTKQQEENRNLLNQKEGHAGSDNEVSETKDSSPQKSSVLPSKQEENRKSFDQNEEHVESSHKHSKSMDSSPRKSSISPTKQQEEKRNLLDQKEGHAGSDNEVSKTKDSSPQKSSEQPSKQEENKSFDQNEKHVESSHKHSESMDSSPMKSSVAPLIQEEDRKSLDGKVEHVESSPKHGESTDSSPRKSSASTSEQEENKRSLDEKEEHVESSSEHSESTDSSPRNSSVSPSKQEKNRNSLDETEELSSSSIEDEHLKSERKMFVESPAKELMEPTMAKEEHPEPSNKIAH